MIEDQEPSNWFDEDEPPRAEMSESRAGEEVEVNWFHGQAFLPTPQGEPPNLEHDIELTWKQENAYESIRMPVASSVGSAAEPDDDTEQADESGDDTERADEPDDTERADEPDDTERADELDDDTEQANESGDDTERADEPDGTEQADEADTPAEPAEADAEPDPVTAGAGPQETNETSAETMPADAPGSEATTGEIVPEASESADSGDNIGDAEATDNERTGDESPERDTDPSETMTSDTAGGDRAESDESEERLAESPGVSVDQLDGDDQFTRSPAESASAPEPQVENAEHEQAKKNNDTVNDNLGLLSKLKLFIRSKLGSTRT